MSSETVLIKTKIVTLALLAKKVRALQRAGKGVVFTNGCFDILHFGHVSYLERARSLGDVLIVAVNSDASVRKLEKGPNRPINPLADRMSVVAALQSVTWVTSFREDTPLRLIKALRPNVLVKGGDWKPHQIVGGKEVIGWGGKVVSLKTIPGRSTTRTLEKAARHPPRR